MLSTRLSFRFSLLASDNAAFAAQFQKHIANPFIKNDQHQQDRHMTFKAEFDKAFCQKEEKELYNPGEIGPIKVKRV